MEIPTNYENKFSPKPDAPKIRSERDELISKFFDHDLKIKPGGRLRTATAGELAVILAFVKTNELHALLKRCEGADSFSRLFWWWVRQNRPVPKVRQRVAEPVGDGGDVRQLRGDRDPAHQGSAGGETSGAGERV